MRVTQLLCSPILVSSVLLYLFSNLISKTRSFFLILALPSMFKSGAYCGDWTPTILKRFYLLFLILLERKKKRVKEVEDPTSPLLLRCCFFAIFIRFLDMTSTVKTTSWWWNCRNAYLVFGGPKSLLPFFFFY